MKNLSGLIRRYSSDFFVLRSPLLPISLILSFFDSLRKDSELLTPLLKQIYQEKIIQEAIYLSSESLYRDATRYLDGTLIDKNHIQRTEQSLFQYLVRMSARCTPFGLFSGCTLGKYGNRTQVNMEKMQSIRRHLRLDMDYLCQLANDLEKIPGISEKLQFFPNSSLYKLKNEFRYVEYNYSKSRRLHNLVTIGSDAVVASVLNRCRKGLTHDQILGYIVSLGYEADEAKKFTEELMQAQVLKSALDPNVTGDDFLTRLIDVLKETGAASNEVRILSSVKNEIESINSRPISVENYSSVQRKLAELLTPFPEKGIYQVDSGKTGETVTFKHSLVQDVLGAIDATSLTNNFDNTNLQLEMFKRAFRERYEYAAVPLCEALDPENGIGYQTAISTQDLYQRNSNKVAWSESLKFKIRKYEEAIASKNFEILLTDEELSRFSRHAPPPSSFAAIGSLALDDRGQEVILLKSVSGPSAANLLGRFCHMDFKLQTAVKRILQQEEESDPGKIFAEIAHLPQSRIGNILSRPHLRKYEIVYLAKSTLPESKQIKVNDLLLKIESSGELKLYSKKLKKEVVPRLSTAHNFSFDSLPLYHFLCDLQGQNVQRVLGWNWDILSREDFMPRVRYKNVIVSPASWNLKPSHFKNVMDVTPSAFVDQFTHYASQRRIPRLVSVVESDNELLLDTSIPYCINLIQKLLKKGRTVKLNECWHAGLSPVVHSEEGVFSNEFIIPFAEKTETKKDEPTDNVFGKPKRIVRTFHPGSEWMFFKIYCGKKTADHFIADKLLTLSENLFQGGFIDKWFFLRYRDPKFHLRIRYHLPSKRKHAHLLKLFTTTFKAEFENKAIYNVQIESYNRELERYGFQNFHITETLFSLSSSLVCEVIAKHPEEEMRFVATAIWVDSLMTFFRFTVNDKLRFTRQAFGMFGKEFNITTNKHYKKQLNEDFRKTRPRLHDALSADNVTDEEVHRLKTLFKGYESRLRENFKLTGVLPDEVEARLMSHNHMFINRIFLDDSRRKEMIIYFFLEKHYMSEEARVKSKT